MAVPEAEPALAAPHGKTQRVRDPVHGLIVFREGVALDQLAWRLIQTPEFQRLRRIKQLGVSEFVFPGATHTRFAHSIGVFHVARGLAGIIEREIGKIGQDYDEGRAEVAVIAALLHDIGHGPFSHTFEGVQRSRGVAKRHETWTAELILDPAGAVRPILDARRDGLADEVAQLLESEDPADIFHAIVSSSFDADRLDYLRRDRMMTGTGAGAIDFDWLMEQVRIAEVSIDAPDAGSDEPVRVATFCLDLKALPAAEQFLLSRYTLHEQVYFHKTTRCIEKMIGRLLKRVADLAVDPATVGSTGLDAGHPLIRFYAKNGETPFNYLALDDVVVGGAIERMVDAPDPTIGDLAERLRSRRLFKTLNITDRDAGRQALWARRIDKRFERELATGAVIKDQDASVRLYTAIGGDDDKTHKKLHVLDENGHPLEITKLSLFVGELAGKREYVRYYFEDESMRDAARGMKPGEGA